MSNSVTSEEAHSARAVGLIRTKIRYRNEIMYFCVCVNSPQKDQRQFDPTHTHIRPTHIRTIRLFFFRITYFSHFFSALDFNSTSIKFHCMTAYEIIEWAHPFTTANYWCWCRFEFTRRLRNSENMKRTLLHSESESSDSSMPRKFRERIWNERSVDVILIWSYSCILFGACRSMIGIGVFTFFFPSIRLIQR